MSSGRRGGNLLSKDQLLFWSLWFGVPAAILVLGSGPKAFSMAREHAPRVLGILSAGALGWWLGARLSRHVGRTETAFRRTAALALALLAWAIVPTLSGRSPATVVTGTRRVAAALRAVDASDLVGFIRSASAREPIEAWQFPTMRAWSDNHLAAAEQFWAVKVADDLVAKLEALAPSDLKGYLAVTADPRLGLAAGRGLKGRIDEAFSAWGKRAAMDLAAALGKVKPGDVDGFLRGRPDRARLGGAIPAHASIVSEAEEAWVVGSVAALEIAVEPLLSSDPKRVSEMAVQALTDFKRCGATGRVLSKVDQLREKALTAGLEQAKQESLALVKDKKYEAAFTSAARFRTKWAGEAKEVKKSEEVDQFAEGYAFLADLARLAKRPDPK